MVCGLVTVKADPVGEIAGYSVLSKEQIQSALEGTIESTRGPGFSLLRGIQTQSVFRSKLAPAALALALEQWDPTTHLELGTALHQPLKAGEALDSLKMLTEQSDIGLIAKLLPSLLAAVDHPGRWPLLDEEQARLNKAAPKNNKAAADWLDDVLARRSEAVLRGGLQAALPILIDGQKAGPGDEINLLLNQTPETSKRFSGLIATAMNGKGGTGRGYWEVFHADHDPDICLGQAWKASVGNRYQVLDAQYYVSTGYYVSVTLYEIYPVEGGSLVWRGDYLSAPMLSSTKGMERMAYALIMQKETKKAVEAFLKDQSAAQ
jgi:hypothetical protein